MNIEPHLAETHEQFPDGFPARVNDDLLGHWPTVDGGMVVVEHHPHGYEVHLGPCYDLENCGACAPDRGPSNPHTDDGHHFRECPDRGVVLTVAGGEVGRRAVLEYLSTHGSRPHMFEFARTLADDDEREAAEREAVRLENEAALAEQESHAPSPEQRLTALEAELRALRKNAPGGKP